MRDRFLTRLRSPFVSVERRRETLVLALLFGFFSAVYVSTDIEPVQGDGYYTYIWARSLAFDFDLDLANDYALCGDRWGMSEPHRPGLGVRNQWNPGAASFWTPMLWVGRLLHVGQPLSPQTKAACSGPIANVGVFGTVIMGWLCLLFCFRTCKRHFGSGPALVAIVAIALTTQLLYYTSFISSYGHTPAAFGAALFVDTWDRTRRNGTRARSTRHWALLGLALGYAMLMRPQSAVFVLLPLADWLAEARRMSLGEFKKHVARGVLFTAAIVLAFSPQLLIWYRAYGTIFAVPQGHFYMRWGSPSIDGVFFASTGGLLIWTPFLYLSLLGLFGSGFSRRPFAARALILVFAITTYVNAAVWDYWGSASFSNRRFTAAMPIFAFGFAATFAFVRDWALDRPRRALGVSAALAMIPFAIWNYHASVGVAQASILSHREQPATEIWADVGERVSRKIYEQIGNPLALPASLPFALFHGVHPSVYDVERGMGVFYAEYQDRRPRRGEETARFGTNDVHRRYAVSGFVDGAYRSRETIKALGDARLLFPVFIDRYRSIDITWAAEVDDENGADVRVEYQGVDLGTFELGSGWKTTNILIPAIVRDDGVVDIRFFHAGAPIHISTLRYRP